MRDESSSSRIGIRHGSDQIPQELGGDHLAGLPVQFDKGELAGPVDCHEEAQLALGGLHLGNIDVERGTCPPPVRGPCRAPIG